jgi:hypothetical protein
MNSYGFGVLAEEKQAIAGPLGNPENPIMAKRRYLNASCPNAEILIPRKSWCVKQCPKQIQATKIKSARQKKVKHRSTQTHNCGNRSFWQL